MPLTPGSVLAERYRLVSPLGQGGMGEVWRADDLVLETAVALKVVHAANPDARARLLNEVRLARQITHPAVCRMFDVGEAGQSVFLSMELVQGEDLASLLKHAGRLPSEKVIEIARQLCDGLAAAHAQGVLHRDLKPANILMDEAGRARITDFGIATTRTNAAEHTVIGTPGYMAPEQRTQNAPLTEQTDLYALGLVLWQLLVGQHPLAASRGVATLPRPSTLVPGVDARLERAILQATALVPRDRPASASAMAAQLAGEAVPLPRGGGRRWIAGLAAAAVILAAAIAATFVVSPRAASLDAQDTIVLADFANSTGEPVFDGALKVALAVALEQSPFLKVFADERVRETMRLMERGPDEPLTRAVAREVARREDLKALIAGSIAKLGAHYVLALEAINAENGDVMAREQIEAATQEDVLGALGRAAVRLREKLGESLSSIQRFDVSLPRATTQSLEALHAYARGLDEGRMDPTREAIARLKQAIDLDPDFAMALASLSGLYANLGQSALAPDLSKRAFDLRDRVSERERFFISWRYYRDATQDWERGLELARSWAATYPRESPAFNSVGFAAVTLGQHEAAIGPLRDAIRLDPLNFAPPENLAVTLIALNRLDEAKQVLRDGRAAQKRYFFAQARQSYLVALLENDEAGMARVLQEGLSQPDPTSAANWRPRRWAFEGRVMAAHDEYRQSVNLARSYRLDEIAARDLAQDAEVHALAGQCRPARAEVGEALGLSRDSFALGRVVRTLALCGAPAEAEALIAELRRRFPEATLTRGLAIPIVEALLALERNDPRRVIEALEPTRLYDRAGAAEFWPNYLRGQAFLALKDGEAAGPEFQAILDHRGRMADAPLYPLARLGAARAALMTGNVTLARTRYDEFLAAWKNADADVVPWVDAKREAAAIK